MYKNTEKQVFVRVLMKSIRNKLVLPERKGNICIIIGCHNNNCIKVYQGVSSFVSGPVAMKTACTRGTPCDIPYRKIKFKFKILIVLLKKTCATHDTV